MDQEPVQINTPQPSSPLRSLISGDQGFLKAVLLPSLIIIAVILAGMGTGWVFSKRGAESSLPGEKTAVAPGAQIGEGGKEVGLEDTATFRDSAQGVVEKDGIDGEGTHHLVRDGGPSQYVYLTSSVVDLNQFVGKRVEVWGETIDARKAGWLMDVGRVKVLE